jgi:hypothetical protein
MCVKKYHREKCINTNTFNQPIGSGVLPQSLTHLIFSFNFQQIIDVNNIPKTLTHFTCHGPFYVQMMNQKSKLPKNIKHVTFGDDFDISLKSRILPKMLTHLTFGSKFNQYLDAGDLPQTLTHLTLGKAFNKQLSPGVLPSKLEHLTTSNEDLAQHVKILQNQGTLPSFSLTYIPARIE